jgi:hypothetical protein
MDSPFWFQSVCPEVEFFPVQGSACGCEAALNDEGAGGKCEVNYRNGHIPRWPEPTQRWRVARTINIKEKYAHWTAHMELLGWLTVLDMRFWL